MGSAFIVVTDNDQNLAQRCAKELSDYLVAHRQEFRGEMIDVDRALELAADLPKPGCLLDMGDNVGGGSPGDGTILAQAIHDRGIRPAFVCIFDPDSVANATAAGEGATIELTIGGKTDAQHGAPLSLRVTVRSFHAGKFSETQARHGGMTEHDMGPTVIVETDQKLTIMLTSRRVFPVSLNQLISCGLDPKSFALIVAKGVHAPVAAYAAVCPTLIRVNTPGVTSADMLSLRYEHRRKPLFPFEKIARD
jgi:microcystin degradation protein MlrC